VIALKEDTAGIRVSPEVDDIALAAAGDTAAFERLYRRYLDKINGLARWLVGPDEAEDAVQDVFIRVWQKLSQFEGRSAFGTWLHRLAVSVLLRRRETRGIREQRHVAGEEGYARVSGPAITPDLRVAIEAAVDRLPDGAREVFVLHDMEWYRHEEIGELLGVTSGTSRSQLHRARMILKEFLGESV
jgi:RNA polymerase sigma-70 factor (ECF subfamily)